MQHLFQASFSCGGVDILSPADAPTSLLVGVHFRAHSASVLLCVWHSFGWKDGIIISSWLTFVYGISSFIDLYKVRSLNFCSNAGFVLDSIFLFWQISTCHQACTPDFYLGSNTSITIPYTCVLCHCSYASWKVLENQFDLRKSWKSMCWVLEFGSQWCWCWCQDMRVHTHYVFKALCVRIVSLLLLHNMWQWWTYTPVWMLLSYYIHMVSNCCLSLYFNIAGLQQSTGKCFWSTRKSWNFL